MSAPVPPGDEWLIPAYLAALLAEDPSIAAELLSTFNQDARKQIAALRKAVAESNIVMAKKVLHGLKGSCGQMGMLAIADRCVRLEESIDSSALPEILRQVGDLETWYEHLIIRMNSRSES